MREDIRQKLKAQNTVNYEKVEVRMRTAVCIAEAMASVGVTNSDLARMMGKSPSEITKWLSGTHNFTIDTLTEISNALNVEIQTDKRAIKTYVVDDLTYSPYTVFEGKKKNTIKLPIHKARIKAEPYSYTYAI